MEDLPAKYKLPHIHLSAVSVGSGLQAFQASAKLPSFGGYSYVT